MPAKTLLQHNVVCSISCDVTGLQCQIRHCGVQHRATAPYVLSSFIYS